MKKVIAFTLSLFLSVSPCFAAWDKAKPAGTDNRSDLDTIIQANNAALESSLQNMRGWVNLKVVRTSVSVVTVTANELWLQKSADLSRNFSTVSEAIDITASGASGLDAGAESADAWYYVWIIAKDDNTIDGLLSASSTAPTLPSGYTYKTLVSAVHNTSSDFVDFIQTGRKYSYSSWPVMASGSVGTGTWVAIDTTAFVPSALSDFAYGKTCSYGASGGAVGITNDNTISVAFYNVRNGMGGGTSSNDSVVPVETWQFNIITANTLYWISSLASHNLFIHGFEITKI